MRRIGFTVCLVAGLVAALTQSGVATQSPSGHRFPTRLPNGRPAPAVSVFPQASSEAGGRGGGTDGCSRIRSREGRPDNIRVNQDCGFSQQAEEWVDVNPRDFSNVVVSQNDKQTGFNDTSVSASTSSGTTFHRNYPPPGLNQAPTSTGGIFDYPRCSDPASAFDSRGNYFYTCVAFNLPYGNQTAILAWRSNHCFEGTFLHAPREQACTPRPIVQQPALVVDNEAHRRFFWDKELMAADTYAGSPYRDNVYITATRFDDGCHGYCESPIWFFRSSDGGATWSGREISGANRRVCQAGDAFNPHFNQNKCNFDQGSFAVVEPSGAIDVVFNNTNTPTLVAQQLFVRSTNGGNTWSTPAKVADDYDTQPFNVTGGLDQYGCAPFRQCLPPNGYRMNDYPAMGLDAKTGHLAVFWSDFRNGGPCQHDEDTGLPVPPCANYDNDVFVSLSQDHGRTWSAPVQVTSGGQSAQWQAWGDFGENGNLYVGYYDRGYGHCENTGCNDITMASSSNGGASWAYQRVTTGSMPNLTCQNNPVQCGFLGDYMSLRYGGGTVFIVWADTRARNGPRPDEDIYLAKILAS